MISKIDFFDASWCIHETFDKYLVLHSDPQKSTCNRLKAALMQNMVKLKKTMSVGFLPPFVRVTAFLKHRAWSICRKASGEFSSASGIYYVDLICVQLCQQ
jgi:hypothetical protein